MHVKVDVWIIYYVGSGLDLKHMEKEKIELPWGDFFQPAQRACGRRFYWGGRGWRALPEGFKCVEFKILAVSIAAPPHQAYTGAPAGASTMNSTKNADPHGPYTSLDLGVKRPKLAVRMVRLELIIRYDDRGCNSFPRAPGIMIPGIGAVS